MERKKDTTEDKPLIQEVKPKRKLRVLTGKKAFKRCRKCRSVNPLSTDLCLNCGASLEGEDNSQSAKIEGTKVVLGEEEINSEGDEMELGEESLGDEDLEGG